jgi:hypothetical protein
MKLTKVSTIVALALGGLVAMSTMVSAQDAATPGKGKGKGRFATVEQQMERLTTELTLTDAQKPKVKAVLEETNKKRQDLRNDSSVSGDRAAMREKMQAIMDDQDKKLKEILDAGQMEKYKKYQEDMRKKGKGGGGGGGGGGTPPDKKN